MLEIKDLDVLIDHQNIITNLNLKINDGEIHCLIGPNGAGKSTVSRVILKDPAYQITKGTIFYHNQDLTTLSTTEIAQLGIMLINQNPLEIEGVSNAEMLRTALTQKTKQHVDIFAFNKKLEGICEQLNVPKDFIHRNINEGMSGGERKKNELVHVWMLEPKLLILDEIDSGLDIDALKTVIASIKDYHQQYQAALLVITHNPKLIKLLEPDYIHILKDQTIIKTGSLDLLSTLEKDGFAVFQAEAS